MLIQQEMTLSEMFRAQAEIKRRDLQFYLDTERAFEDRKIQVRREEEQRETLEAWERATHEQIAAFRDHLDHYDTAVVEALTDNEEALGKARESRERIEAAAHRLPDGRMVFKSDDGKRVVDRDGNDLPASVASPESIPDKLPRAGAYRDALNEERRLEKERDGLHRYQQKLDDARDAINKGDVSKKELDTLDADLQSSMPNAVKQKLAHPGESREAGISQTDTPSPATPTGERLQKRPDPLSLSPR